MIVVVTLLHAGKCSGHHGNEETLNRWNGLHISTNSQITIPPPLPPLPTFDDVSSTGLCGQRHACEGGRHDGDEETKDELQAAHTALLHEEDEEAARKERGGGERDDAASGWTERVAASDYCAVNDAYRVFSDCVNAVSKLHWTAHVLEVSDSLSDLPCSEVS